MIVASKPLQKTTWAEKVANDKDFFKRNIDWGIEASAFRSPGSTSDRLTTLLSLYNVYNSKFPNSWFTHILDPFSALDPNHKKWAGKIRPANIIRPNIDYLRATYAKRAFDYEVTVKGETGYNNFLEARKQALLKNLSQHFINTVNESLPQGADTQVDTQQAQPPEQLVAEFSNDYRDMLATDAQEDLNLIIEEQNIREKLNDIMKDWLIAGEAWSYKDVIKDKVIYERVSPLEMAGDKALSEKYGQHGSWACRRQYLTVPDVVDRFYDTLKPSDIEDIEKGSALSTSSAFYNYLSNSESLFQNNKVPVYHFTWKSLQKMGFLKGTDPTTGEEYTDIVNDTYTAKKELGETIEWEWVVQVLGGYRILDNIYAEMQPVTYQSNMISDFSRHKLPYNWKMFSDTHSDNISVAKLGLPFQIMFCILFFTCEKTIARSKGKIVLLDKNVIPRSHGWTEEKFFWYSEAQGYMLVDRNQQGADRSMNQYQVLDLSAFQHIQELIKLMDWCKSQFDEQLGINRQAKAQMAASESAEAANQAIAQSSIILEMIFYDFDGFVKSDIEGLIDCSQIANRNGKRATYVTEDLRTGLLDINPDNYCYSELGIVVTNNAKEQAALERIRQYTQAFAQNDMSPAAIVEIETANNISKLKGILKEVEQKQIELSQQQQQTDHENEVEKIQIQQQFAEYNNLLKTEFMDQEYTRKEEMVILQGDINLAIQNGAVGLPEDSGADTINAIMDRQTQRDQMLQERDMHDKSEENKNKQEQAKILLEEKKLAAKHREITSKERVAKANQEMQYKIAKMRPKPTSSVKR